MTRIFFRKFARHATESWNTNLPSYLDTINSEITITRKLLRSFKYSLSVGWGLQSGNSIGKTRIGNPEMNHKPKRPQSEGTQFKQWYFDSSTSDLKLTLLPSVVHHRCLLEAHEGKDCPGQVGIYTCIYSGNIVQYWAITDVVSKLMRNR